MESRGRTIGRLTSVALAIAASSALAPSTALGSAACVQEELAGLGYQPGPADGVLGRRSVGAANLFAGDTGLTLPDLTDDTAGQWCEEIQTFAASPEAAILSTFVGQLLPKDVLLGFASVDPNARANLCDPRVAIREINMVEPIKKIEGFTSDMRRVVKTLPNVTELDEFVFKFGQLATRAYAGNDAALKGQLLDILERWALEGALLDTTNCMRPNGTYKKSLCTQWTVRDGSDLSPTKDWEFTMDRAVGLIRIYYIALVDFEPDERDEQHRIIKDWLEEFPPRLRPARSVNVIYDVGRTFMDAIVNDYVGAKPDAARAKLQRVEKALNRFLQSDGSIEKATTRGDRALWYQYTSLSDAIIATEMIRAAGLPLSGRVEEKLHKAVALFVAAVEDPDVLDPWARKRHNATYDGRQDFDFARWHSSIYRGSWLYIYPYRYPDRVESKELLRLVPPDANSATSDWHFGIGLGCVYNAAADSRLKQIGMDVDPSVLASTASERLQAAREAYDSEEYLAAFEHLNPLARMLGDAEAQAMLARLYSDGKGVLQDPAESAVWYRRAAEQDVVAAQFRLGVILRRGAPGVPRDRAEAARWFERAAEAGDRNAQYNLGKMYQLGQGVAADEAEALKWFRLAADQGHKGAVRSIESIEQP